MSLVLRQSCNGAGWKGVVLRTFLNEMIHYVSFYCRFKWWSVWIPPPHHFVYPQTSFAGTTTLLSIICLDWSLYLECPFFTYLLLNSGVLSPPLRFSKFIFLLVILRTESDSELFALLEELYKCLNSIQYNIIKYNTMQYNGLQHHFELHPLLYCYTVRSSH